MGYKMVISDLDGTFFGRDFKINPKNIESIKKLNEHGIIFCIATGRPDYSTIRIANQIGGELVSYIITFNGSRIADSKTGKIIHDMCVNGDDGRHIIKEMRKHDACVIAYIDGKPCTHYEDVEALEYGRATGSTVTIDSEFEDKHKGGYNKVILRGEPADLERVQAALSDWADGRVTCVFSAPNLLEYINIGASKGNAMLILSDKLGIDKKHIVAMGDYYNDIPMLKEAGFSATMAASPDEIKAICDFVATVSPEDGAAAEVIETAVFGK